MVLQVHEQMAALKSQQQETEDTERRTSEVREQFWHQKQKVSDMDLQVRKHKSAKKKAEVRQLRHHFRTIYTSCINQRYTMHAVCYAYLVPKLIRC